MWNKVKYQFLSARDGGFYISMHAVILVCFLTESLCVTTLNRIDTIVERISQTRTTRKKCQPDSHKRWNSTQIIRLNITQRSAGNSTSQVTQIILLIKNSSNFSKSTQCSPLQTWLWAYFFTIVSCNPMLAKSCGEGLARGGLEGVSKEGGGSQRGGL